MKQKDKNRSLKKEKKLFKKAFKKIVETNSSKLTMRDYIRFRFVEPNEKIKILNKLEKSNALNIIKIKILIRALKEEKEVKEKALAVLENINVNSYKILSKLSEDLDNKDLRIKRLALAALMNQGDLGYILASAWAKDWFEGFGGDYKRAVKMAKSLEGEEREELINYLLSKHYLYSEYKDVVKSVLEFIENIQYNTDKLIKHIIYKTNDERWTIKQTSIKALMNQGDLGYILASAWAKDWFEGFGGDYKRAVKMAKSLKGDKKEKFIDYLTQKEFINSEWIITSHIIDFIKDVELKDKKIFNTLFNTFKEDERFIREKAVKTIVSLSKKNKIEKEIIKTTIKLLKNKDWKIREGAALILGEFSIKEDNILYNLFNAFTDKNRDVRKASAYAVAKIAKQNKIKELMLEKAIELISSQDSRLKSASIYLIGELGIRNKRILDLLLKTLKEKDEDIRYATILTLEKLNIKTKILVKTLLSTMIDEDMHVSWVANRILKNFAKQDPKIKQMIEASKEFKKGLEECDSSKVRAIEELL